MEKKTNNPINNNFIDDVKVIIDNARQNAVRSVDFCRVQMYWNIGKRIFEEEQEGKDRADYGSYLIKNLANNLIPEYGKGFSVRQLERSRQFYRLYPMRLSNKFRRSLFMYRDKIDIRVRFANQHLILYIFYIKNKAFPLNFNRKAIAVSDFFCIFMVQTKNLKNPQRWQS